MFLNTIKGKIKEHLSVLFRQFDAVLPLLAKHIKYKVKIFIKLKALQQVKPEKNE